jgi:uncharacterized protein YbjT (DUF2867 family)
MQSNLVVGATGILGREVCRQLRAAGRPVRGLVRSTSSQVVVQELQALGVELRFGDLKAPASLVAALDGVSHVISTASASLSRSQGDDFESVDRNGQLNLTAAARASGVSQLVLLSFPETPLSFPLQDAKRGAEAGLTSSGVPFTVIRPPHFFEVWFSEALGCDLKARQARVFAGGNGRMSWVSLGDVARIAIASLGNDRALNRTLTFGGPQAVSQREVLGHFEQPGASPLRIDDVPLTDLTRQFETSESPLERSFAALMLIAGQGDKWQFDNACLEGIIDCELTSARDFALASSRATA